jgi:hypothetical protein
MDEIVQEVELDYQPRDVFLDFHEREQRWAVIIAHRRAGKTVSCLNDALYRAIMEGKEDGRYAYVAPYYAQAKTIAWDYLLKFSRPVLAKANQSELWVELVNGARIRLFGADNPDAMRGLYLDGVVLDEYADMKPSIWGAVIRPLLADRQGWATFIGTPKGHNQFWDVYNKATKDPDWFVKTLRASQTNLLPESELADAAKSMTEDQYLQEFECDFESAILGAYYGKEMRQLTDQGRIQPIKFDRNFPLFSSWDLGYSDDTTIWTWQVVHGEIRFLDYHSSNGQSIPFYTGYIAQQEEKYKVQYKAHYLPHDAKAKTLASGGKSIIEQLSAKIKLESMKIVPNLSLQDGIQATRMMLLRSWFDPKCEDGLECLRQYERSYNEDKKVFSDKPLHNWASHGADAARMAAIAWQEEAKLPHKDDAIRGLFVGQTDVSLNEMWKQQQPNIIRRI